jgi:hypothetical protein
MKTFTLTVLHAFKNVEATQCRTFKSCFKISWFKTLGNLFVEGMGEEPHYLSQFIRCAAKLFLQLAHGHCFNGLTLILTA